MEQPAQRIVLHDSLAELDHQSERLAALDAAVWEQSGVLSEPMQRVVAALVCLYGVQELTAVTVVAETGDLGRFAKAPQLFSYAGWCPESTPAAGRTRVVEAASPRPAMPICDGFWWSRPGTIDIRPRSRRSCASGERARTRW